ncbi:MAG: hypothetical protein HUK04_00375 [Bacteroidaceae bacterium]|nr:hypothetical protein [Bacteroidaceae bacterium]
MRKEILDALKAKFPGVSESVLGRIADKIAKTATTAEQVKTVVEGVTIQQVIDSYADSRATEASQTAVRNYEDKHGIKDGKPVETPNPQPTGGEQQPATQGGADESTALLKQLLARMDKLESDRTATSRKERLNALTSKLPEHLRKVYDRYPVEKYTDEEFNTLLSEVTTEVEGFADETAAKGGVFGKPSAANGGSKTELSEAQIAAISHREGQAKDGAQPF